MLINEVRVCSCVLVCVLVCVWISRETVIEEEAVSNELAPSTDDSTIDIFAKKKGTKRTRSSGSGSGSSGSNKRQRTSKNAGIRTSDGSEAALDDCDNDDDNDDDDDEISLLQVKDRGSSGSSSRGGTSRTSSGTAAMTGSSVQRAATKVILDEDLAELDGELAAIEAQVKLDKFSIASTVAQRTSSSFISA